MCILTNLKINKIILILIIIGLVTGIWLSYGRHRVEQANRTVDMVFEYEEIVHFAGQSGKSIEETMRLFKESGITSLAVYETTLERLEEKGLLQVVGGNEILHKKAMGLEIPSAFLQLVDFGKIKKDEVYIISPKNNDILEVESDLKERFSDDRISILREDSPRIIAVKGDYKFVKEQHLGLLSSDLRDVARNGFSVVVRPTNYKSVTKENINSVFARLDKAKVDYSAMLFSSSEVLGYPHEMETVAQNLLSRKITLGMTEHPLQLQFDKQEGLVELGELVDYNVARLYVIDKTEQEKRLDVPQAVRRWALTDEERNVRMNFLRAFKEATPGKTLLETNLEYVSLVRDSVAKRDFLMGPAAIFEKHFPNKIFFIPLFFGAAAAGVFYLASLTNYLNEKRQVLLTLTSAGLLSILFFATNSVLIRQAFAFLSAVIFPTIAIMWQMRNWEKLPRVKSANLFTVLFKTSWQLVATVLLSLIGGAYVSGILGDTRFFLEIDIYRGVKLTFLMPLLLVSLIYLKWYKVLGPKVENESGLIAQLRELMNYPLYVKTVLLMGIGAVVAYIFIGRTGHTAGLPVPGLEVKMRVFLEEVMYARPREKEFLVGHPSFFLAALAAWRNWPHLVHYSLVMGATIGQGCLVETFAHMRTPVIMSFVRAIDGLFMGLVIGIFAVIGALICLFTWKYLVRRYERGV